MFIFEDEHDLMRSVQQCIDRAQRQAMDTTNLKREQMVARARAAAFTEVLDYLKDYFAARTAPPAPTQQEASEESDPTNLDLAATGQIVLTVVDSELSDTLTKEGSQEVNPTKDALSVEDHLEKREDVRSTSVLVDCGSEVEQRPDPTSAGSVQQEPTTEPMRKSYAALTVEPDREQEGSQEVNPTHSGEYTPVDGVED